MKLILILKQKFYNCFIYQVISFLLTRICQQRHLFSQYYYHIIFYSRWAFKPIYISNHHLRNGVKVKIVNPQHRNFKVTANAILCIVLLEIKKPTGKSRQLFDQDLQFNGKNAFNAHHYGVRRNLGSNPSRSHFITLN